MALTALLLAAVALPAHAGRGVATQYAPSLAGRPMAWKELRYRPGALTVATRNRADLGRRVRLSYRGRSVTALAADLGRLPFPKGLPRHGKRFDLSTRTARRLGLKRNQNAVIGYRWL